jgi:hypothetical protein
VIKSRKLRWARYVARILSGKPTEKRPIGRPGRSWEDHISIHFKEIGINKRNWVDSA